MRFTSMVISLKIGVKHVDIFEHKLKVKSLILHILCVIFLLFVSLSLYVYTHIYLYKIYILYLSITFNHLNLSIIVMHVSTSQILPPSNYIFIILKFC